MGIRVTTTKKGIETSELLKESLETINIVKMIEEINNVKDHINYINIINDPNDKQYHVTVKTLFYVGIGKDDTIQIEISYSKDNTYVLADFPSRACTIDFMTLGEMKDFIMKWNTNVKKLIFDMYEDIRFHNQKNR